MLDKEGTDKGCAYLGDLAVKVGTMEKFGAAIHRRIKVCCSLSTDQDLNLLGCTGKRGSVAKERLSFPL